MGTAVLWAVGKVQVLLPGGAARAASWICAPGQPILSYLRPINAAFNLGTFLMIYRLMYRTRKVGCWVGRSVVGWPKEPERQRGATQAAWLSCLYT